MSYDLHVHSTASDGIYTPRQIVKLAHQLGLTGIALTDHDTVDGVKDALIAGDSEGLDVIPGIEINTDYGEVEVHILGYGIEQESLPLRKKLAEIKEARVSRGSKIIDKLAALGLPLTWNEVTELAAGGVIGRPHIAMAMIKRGYVNSVKEAFDQYIGRGKEAYVPRYKVTPKEAAQIVVEAGGCPVLAHPGLVRNDQIISEIIKLVQGIEVYYPEHSAREIEKWNRLAENRGLLITGGSDFHGLPGNKNGLGIETASLQQVKELRAYLAGINKNIK
ncbi:MAG: PHP domain-containing protein [Methylocystaceae bacterium]